MTDFEQALIERDGMTAKAAQQERSRAHDMVYAILDGCGDYDDVEEMLSCEYGLEMDYIMDLI